MKLNTYRLELSKNSVKLSLSVWANESVHAQAQAQDICRALSADEFHLKYENIEPCSVADLFKRLAFNEFNHNECHTWDLCCNKSPCLYAFKKRFFVKQVILKYLDIPTDNPVRMTCDCRNCINPYHYNYVLGKNSKLSTGDRRLLVAYQSQGASIPQVAKAFKVHRSTIYRNLKDERLCSRSSDHIDS